MSSKLEFSLINSNEEFKEHCHNKNKPCVLAFLDGRDNAVSKKSFQDSMSVLDKVLNGPKARSFTFSYVNATCQVKF